MMANLSQIKRQGMLEFLNRIREEHREDDAALIAINEIESELNDKKYGLVWEEHQEQVDVEMLTKVPIFSEQAEKEITADETLPYNFLLEGDNLHSLKLLEKTHKGKIDLIYIDPPYNTGSKDFIYDDLIVDRTDNFRHSKWLSFIHKRLEIARELLSEKGLIFISIDDNEVAQLKMLCDTVFGDTNFRGQIARSTGTPTGQGNSILINEIDYIIVYSKTDKAVFNGLPFSDEDAKIYNMEDEYGKYLIRPLRKTGGEDKREDRPSMYYPVSAPDGTKLYPIAPSGYESRWRCAESRYYELCEEHRIEWQKGKDGWKVYQKFYLEGRTKQPSNLWNNIEGNKKATITIKDIFGKAVFDFPKPVELIKRIIAIGATENSVVLDFFAGSGTTAQAVLEMNAEDNGNRKVILCTNNQNNICEEVTYQRFSKVVSGYKNIKGIPANLKYYKTDFIDKTSEDEEYSVGEELLGHIAEMVQLEYAVRLDGKNYVLLLSDEEADSFIANDEKLSACSAVYISTAVLLTTQQHKKLTDNGIAIFVIPDYYFENELLEVGER